MDFSNENVSSINPELKQYLASLYSYLAKNLSLKTTPKLKFLHSKENSDNILGKTGHYDHSSDTISLYVDGRHPKDVLRTFSHEIVHKNQYENQLFNIDKEQDTSPGYAQKNKNLRMAESDAYQRGSLLFRDWEDQIKYGSVKEQINNKEKLNIFIKKCVSQTLK
jgi:hypothetical protein